jgi:hypothetical protein
MAPRFRNFVRNKKSEGRMKKLLLYLVVALALLLPNTAFSQNSPNMSFFSTSAGSGNGANLGGLRNSREWPRRGRPSTAVQKWTPQTI